MFSDPRFVELISLPLSASILQALVRSGYSTVGEVAGLTVERLTTICGTDVDKSADALRLIRRYCEMAHDDESTLSSFLANTHTAYELLGDENFLRTGRPTESAVVSMCRSFDDMMGGGFPIGKLTELCGPPGVGKTQFCIQACLTVQLPRWFGGLEGEAVFIDTEGSFVPRRARQMAEALVDHCRRHLTLQTNQPVTDADRDLHCPTIDKLMSSIHYIRTNDHLQLLAACQRLLQFCEKHPKVILTNQITTRFGPKTGETSDTCAPTDTQGVLVPALGESWGHICSVRVFLTRQSDTRRHAKLLKHPGKPPGTAFYQITPGGIRDCAS
ncbi:unnamed protein product [Dicrocoelium dendriticum]|nr:unnamed protein product [Dicrocoelium dendriticum]